MTNEELCRSVRNAATPRKQIGILAELNQCDKSRIVDILWEGWETLPWPHTRADAGDAAAAGTGETDCHGAAPLAMTGATGSDDYREAEHDPLPAADPEKQAEIIRAETDIQAALPGTVTVPAEEMEKGRVARAAVAAIDKLLSDVDAYWTDDRRGNDFMEQVRGVLALARVLTEGDEHDG